MTEESLQRDREPLIEADLLENGGRIEFESIPVASKWVKQEIEAWRNFGGNVGITSLRGGVLDRQLALPSKIAERLAQAISLEGDELLQTTMEIGGLFKKYADYHSLHSGSAVGMAIRKTRTQRSQRAALGGLACSIGILRAWQSNNSRCTTCHPTDTHTASLAAIYVPPSSFFFCKQY